MRLLAVIFVIGLLTGAPTSAEAASCSHADVVFYSNNSVLLAQRLHAAPSACADYFISVTPAAGGGPRAGVAPTIRSNGAQFHAMPELRLPDWATYVAQNGNDWYAAGVHVRDLMVTAGFDVAAGDTWAINEVGTPSGAQMATDVFNNVDDSRLHLEQFVDGLYTGEPGMPAAPGLIFVANPTQITTDLAAYKHGLDSWYQDAGFWTALSGKVRFWAQETYADSRNWGVDGSALADRTAHLEDYFQHGELFAQADRKASAAARDFIASTYTPVGNSAYAWTAPELNAGGIGFGFTNLDLPLMQNFVSSQTYALRAANARFGYAWWQKSGSATAAQFTSLADRLAASIQGSDTDPVGACGADLGWCDGPVDGRRVHRGLEDVRRHGGAGAHGAGDDERRRDGSRRRGRHVCRDGDRHVGPGADGGMRPGLGRGVPDRHDDRHLHHDGRQRQHGDCVVRRTRRGCSGAGCRARRLDPRGRARPRRPGGTGGDARASNLPAAPCLRDAGPRRRARRPHPASGQ